MNDLRTIEIVSGSEEKTVETGRTMAAAVRPGDVIVLQGELGAGKTRFVRGLAQGLGLDDAAVASPTFGLLHEYASPGARCRLIHVDAYRLRTAEDLETTGWDHAMRAGDAVAAIEWGERVSGELPQPPTVWVSIEHTGEHERLIRVRAREDVIAALAGGLTEVVRAPAAKTRPCAVCGAQVAKGSAHEPFCSARCRAIDLGKWADESYRVSRPVEEADLDQ